MKKLISLLVLGALVVGCASPYAGQREALNASYSRGEISVSEYHARLTDLERLELQRRESRASRLQGAGQSLQNFGNYLQRDRAIRAMDQPQTIYVVPMGR